MGSGFFQSSIDFGAGGMGATGPAGPQGPQGVTGPAGADIHQSGVVVVNPLSQRSILVYPVGTVRVASCKMHLQSEGGVATCSVDMLEIEGDIRHTVYAEMGKVSMYRVLSEVAAGLVFIIVENRTDRPITVTYLGTLL